MTKIVPLNPAAQATYRARGNPPNTLPQSAISNCFPGLEFDLRAIWRRIIVGIVIVENNNFVIAYEHDSFKDLVGHRLLSIDGIKVAVKTVGPVIPGRGQVDLASSGNNPVAFMEWSNTIAQLLDKQGNTVRCAFTKDASRQEVLPPDKEDDLLVKEMQMRRIFEPSSAGDLPSAVLAQELVKPGELSQGLCSPWQNDYRECACYYWAASRPDYVNVEAADDGSSRGDNWMDKSRSGQYILDNRRDSRLVGYDDLFTGWEKALRFQIGGKDAPEERERKP